VSFDISSNCCHFNGSPLLCPINATSCFHMYLDYIIQEYFIVEESQYKNWKYYLYLGGKNLP
jgi:hypothetical protein